MNIAKTNYLNQSIAVIGYGVTGKSCVRFLLSRGAKVSVFDKQINADDSKSHSMVCFCILDENSDLSHFDCIVVSPGVDLQQPFIVNAQHKNINIIGDVELFAREVTCPVIAITGSNGKSTVVDMLTRALRDCGKNVGLGGNFGTPCLDLLELDLDYVVLELSSFQLESTYSLKPQIASVLNITPDHIDRHGSMESYIQAKQSIYRHSEHQIFNRDDPNTYPNETFRSYAHSFGCDDSIDEKYASDQPVVVHKSTQNKNGLLINDNNVVDFERIKHLQHHQLLNMQVVLLCATILNCDVNRVVSLLCRYQGLPHRFELVHKDASSRWFNDSKATNPGATVAAIKSIVQEVSTMSSHNDIVLIAGGDSKGADMTDLFECIQQHVKFLVLMGKDKNRFTHLNVDYKIVRDMSAAVTCSKRFCEQRADNENSTIVLLSPACASIDMYKNYQDRGECFREQVSQLVAI